MAKDDQIYPHNWAGQNTPVSGVVNAVGGFLRGNPDSRRGPNTQGRPAGGPGGQRRGGLQGNGPVINSSGFGGGDFAPSAPRTPSRTANTATQPTGARSTNGARARTGWGLLGGSGWGGSARTTALASNPETTGMANSVRNASGGTTTRVRPGEQMPVTPRNEALRQPGARAVAGGIQTRNASGGTTTRITNPTAFNAANTNVSGNQVIRTRAQMNALPVTPRNQARADAKSAAMQAEAVGRGDANNWAGIARDLGNAGDTRWASHATGELPSTNALKYAAANPTHQAAGSRSVSQARAQGLVAPTAPARATPARSGATAPARSTASARASGMTAAQSTAKRKQNAAAYKAHLDRARPTAGSTQARTPAAPRRRTGGGGGRSLAM